MTTPRRTVHKVVHVMSRRRHMQSGAAEWACCSCRHREVISPSGIRIVLTKGNETVPHGLAYRLQIPGV